MKKYRLFDTVVPGLIVSNMFGMLAIGISKWIVDRVQDNGLNGIFIYSDFVIVPLLMGMITAWFWRKIEMGTRTYLFYSFINCVLAILFSFIFLKEGVICLIIVSPLLFVFIITGVFIGRRMFRAKNNILNVSVVSLLLLIFITDSVSEHHYENCVSDELIINARPMDIWKNVVAFDPIKEPNHYWLFKAGMPSPAATTVDGYYEGAGRKCIFSNGYVFDEKMIVYQPGKNLTFDIVHQPRDPEIMGHIDILRGQFLLKDNGNGTTTLIGNSWYKLYVFPLWYYDIWAQDLTRNVHFRVMEHIKFLSEKK